MRRRLLLAAPALLAPWPAWADIVFYYPPTSGSGSSNAGPRIVATTAGRVSTSSTTEALLVSLKVPANSIGANGTLEIRYITSSTGAGLKTMTGHLSATPTGLTGNTLVASASATNSQQGNWIIRANNATNAELAFAGGPLSPFSLNSGNPVTYTVDMTADSYVNLSGYCANGADTFTLEHAYVVVFPAS